ncbi:hypothetical protein [Methylobacterium sp. Leaf123]|uniref:hypothetical protein n=1 Tax=Methylobacterium sp. Leaf123 TaxID=1736264 RepID=UPI0012E9352A|nr:hypothetical protein [Methylobacterium sp. Leaf123]
MAVVTSDAVQMPPPRAASPGLPPVDPVTQLRAAGDTKAVAMAARQVAESDGGVRPGPGLVNARRPDSDDFQQVDANLSGRAQAWYRPELVKNVAGERGSDPWGDPLPTISLPTCQKPFPPYEQPAETNEDAAAGEGSRMDISEAFAGTCRHSMEEKGKDRLSDPCFDRDKSIPDATPSCPPQVEPQSLALDSSTKTGLACASQPAKRSTRVPPRIADRPRPEEWTDDELLTLPEAAALFWPAGPITTNTLRTAGRDGSLAITKVAGKFFTTPMAIRRMGLDEIGGKLKQSKQDETATTSTLQMKIAEAQRLGGGRARSRRAAKRSVATATNGGSGQ